MKKTISEKINFLESFLDTSLSNDGVNINIWCPFCKHENKNKKKLSIHLKNNIFHCWLCEKKGSNICYLISRLAAKKAEEAKKYFSVNTSNSKNQDLFDAIKSLSRFNYEAEENEDIEELINFPSDFRLLANNFNSTNPDVRDIFRYALNRGIDKHKLWLLRVGFSLQSEFRRSLILPSLDENGSINFYTSRKIDVDTGSSFKYNNAKVQKKNVIFNEVNINWNLPLTIVEGPLDLIKTNDNATCLLGSSLTEDMKLFSKIINNNTEINLALDSDVYYKSITIADLLSSYNINVKILDTRCADDVGDMTKEQFQNCLETAKVYSKETKLLSKIAAL